MTQNFIHLHTHSHYSLLDGLSKIDDLIARARKNNMPALAITDHGSLYGAIEFYKKAKKAEIKPILGVEVYVAIKSRHDRNPGIDNKRFHLTLLAKNNVGYKNLIRLVTLSNTEGFYYKPRVDTEILRLYSEGIICLSGCFTGEISRACQANDLEKAECIAREYQEIFGAENYFIEIEHHPKIEGFNETKQRLIELARRLDMPLVGTQDSHYIDPSDAFAQDVLLAVGTGVDIHTKNRLTMSGEDFSFIDTKTAMNYFKDTPEAVTNTQKIADMCEIELELGNWTFPKFEIKENSTHDEELHRLAYEGIKKRGLKEDKELLDRINYELKVIKDKGYSVYFLIVEDLIRYARENNIFTTIRGSVAGSMTTFLLGITNVNPFEYKLPFERFLNPERPSAPDIDMDFADNRRDEVLDYAREKYGKDKVAQIGTFGKMMAKGSIRDVTRALGHPYSIGDTLASLIPLGSQGFPMTISKALEIEPELKTSYQKNTTTKEIVDLAKKLEGCARHISVHAAGVVISPTSLYDFVPTQFDPKGGKIITQYDMYSVEDAGLIKFDFLGIKNLAILDDAVRLVKKFHDIDIDIENIPVDNKKTFAMLARGETIGLFQLNGAGMTQYLKELKPTVIYDINAMVALYRPGPMEAIPQYIKRKHNPRLVTYLDPRLKDILDQSYGIITYQDDVMLIAIHLAGYSWLEADKLRKAMGKKVPKLMKEQKEKLLKGFIKNGLSQEKADKLWRHIEPFAAYGFNKAHAASYGRVAYQTAYMKANYPAEYMCAILTAESGDTDKIAEIITECARMKLPVLPPNINESFSNFTVIKGATIQEDKIRFGLNTIKNLGYDIAKAIIDERKENGQYISFSNFLDRVHHKNLNKKSLESLVKSGAMDTFEERGKLLGNVENALEYNKYIIKQKGSNQASLFGDSTESTLLSFQLKDSPTVTKKEMLAWEKELLGLYISGHPLDAYREKIEKRGATIKQLLKNAREGTIAIATGVLEETKEIMTKKGEQMAFVKIADFTDSLEIVLFPAVFLKYKNIIRTELCIVVKGKISQRNGNVSLLIDVIKKMEE